jgi:hypothetical protein
LRFLKELCGVYGGVPVGGDAAVGQPHLNAGAIGVAGIFGRIRRRFFRLSGRMKKQQENSRQKQKNPEDNHADAPLPRPMCKVFPF